MNKNTIGLLALITIIYCCAIAVPPMDVDASQYASMSREMLARGNYLHVYDLGKDYLDKPPFLFWINAVSLRIFGVNGFAFKFPSILFALLAIFATYRLATLFYKKEVASLSALVLASSQALFLITNDIRTDTILMGWVITAIWLLAEWFSSKKWTHFVGGCIAIGGGMLTKGPIALLVPVFGFGAHFVLKRDFKQLVRPIYLLGILIIGILLLPMSIGLYQQFDLHPEKLVNGRYGVSGLRFFYWTQSFGRITGESPWNNGAGIGFLLQNMLWSFLPWISYFLVALVINVKNLLAQGLRLRQEQEFISTGGFILTYFSLGLSHYQLPHYIFVAFPLAAIITGKFLYELYDEGLYPQIRKILTSVQYGVLLLLLATPILILIYAFPANNPFVYALLLAGVAGCIYWYLKKKTPNKLIGLSMGVMLVMNAFLSLHFYPQLLQYQAGNMIGPYLYQQHIDKDRFFIYKYNGNIRNLPFYAQFIPTEVSSLQQLKSGDYLLLNESRLPELVAASKKYMLAKQGLDFHVAELTLSFLNKKTRASVCEKYCLIKIL